MFVAAVIGLPIVVYAIPRWICDFCTPSESREQPSSYSYEAVKNFFVRTSDAFIRTVGERNWALFSEIVIENAWISVFVLMLIFPVGAPFTWLLALKMTVGFFFLNFCLRDLRNKTAKLFKESHPLIAQFIAHRHDSRFSPSLQRANIAVDRGLVADINQNLEWAQLLRAIRLQREAEVQNLAASPFSVRAAAAEQDRNRSGG